MKIVIAGAGDIGFHLASLLAKENQTITLIDNRSSILQHTATHLDVLTIKGDATSLDILKSAEVHKAKLFLAVTTHETTNLLACILAKKLGAKKTIARVSNNEYLEPEQRKNFQDIGVDDLFSPRLLAAQEIERLIQRCSVTDMFEFEKGKLSVIGFTADNSSRLIGKPFRDLDAEMPNSLIKTIAILRNGNTMIPKNGMRIKSSDHIYIASRVQDFERLNKYIGKTLQKVNNVMIIGGTSLALQTAKILEKRFNVSIVVEDEACSRAFVEELHNSLVIHGEGSNIELLIEEGLERMDAFIALTQNSETNIITSLTAENLGVYKTIALVDNTAYTHISQNIGVDTLINKKLVAANEIFRFVRKGQIENIASLHGVDAEIIEFVIHKKNRVTRLPLNELHLPDGAVVIGVCSDGEVSIPSASVQLKVGDKVIIFAQYDVIKRVENIFK